MKLMQPPLKQTSAGVLEFESLRGLIRGYTSSSLGQEWIAALSPSINRDWIENQHQLSTEIREYRRVGGHFEFAGLLDISESVQQSRISGAVLETTEIRDVILVVDSAAEWRQIAMNPPAAMKS
jgi:dsDNA-specific endonuclease/ATPase MutS2